MHFSTLVTAATVALSFVSAAPSPERTKKQPACKGNQEWSGWEKQCKCDNGEVFDQKLESCHLKEHPKNDCEEDEKFYCARSSNKWCEYDEKNPICWDDAKSKTFCSKEENLKEKLKEFQPIDHKNCDHPLRHHWHSKQCGCPKGKVYKNKGCIFPPLDEPKCKVGQDAFCAKDPENIIKYDDDEELCENNGKNYAFCSEDKDDKPKKLCQDKWDN